MHCDVCTRKKYINIIYLVWTDIEILILGYTVIYDKTIFKGYTRLKKKKKVNKKEVHFTVQVHTCRYL